MISANYGTADKLTKQFVSEAAIAKNGGFIPTTAKEEPIQKQTNTNGFTDPVSKEDQNMEVLSLTQGM